MFEHMWSLICNCRFCSSYLFAHCNSYHY